MKKILHTMALFLAFALTMTSCLGNTEESEITVYDDTALSAFSLSAINRYVHTIGKSGQDSVYVSKMKFTSYPFTIDQYQRKIYNTDSLPADCDLKHVLVTATATSNSGGIAVKSMISDSLKAFSTTDSIDFSTPREFRVYNNTGQKFRAYEVKINKKTVQESSTIVWKQMPQGTSMPETPMAGWDFILNEARNGLECSNDHWVSSYQETLDEDYHLLPFDGSFACWELEDGRFYALLVGNSDAQEDQAVVWRKVFDNDNPTASSWVFIPPVNETHPYSLPKGQSYFLLPLFDGQVMAVSGNGIIYVSRDQGLTWKTSSALQSPVSDVCAASTDGVGGIWIKEGTENGTIWYGKY